MEKLKNEVTEHLKGTIIPFWENLRDDTYGGYYGLLDVDLQLDKKAVKGCILNSRILWFFSNAYLTLRQPSLLDEAKHAYTFLKDHCLDPEYGGVFWSVTYDGQPNEVIKHTYNQAFAVYALSTYYDASGDTEALDLAWRLFDLIEGTCCDGIGYLEVFTRDFVLLEENDKLSENGVNAEKTMNTLLHVFEAYSELYRITKKPAVADKLRWIMDIIETKVYNPEKKRQEVFFDKNWNTLIDLHSYGHDIETAWLIDRGCEILGDPAYTEKMGKITAALAEKIYEKAFTGECLLNECEKGVDDTNRVWWVQAEAVLGFFNAWEKTGDEKYKKAVYAVWEYIKAHVIDPRPGSEWFSELYENNEPVREKEIVEPWKCPYHNGRMCMEIIRRVK